MKKVLALLMVVAMLFAVAGCNSSVKEIVREKQLTKLNYGSYILLEGTPSGVTQRTSAYDGNQEKYFGGTWRWAECSVTVTAKNATANIIDFTDCVVKAEVDLGSFGTHTVELQLDAQGNASKTIDVVSSKQARPASGYNAGDIPAPEAVFNVDEASGTMKMHFQLDENGSAIVKSSEEQ